MQILLGPVLGLSKTLINSLIWREGAGDNVLRGNRALRLSKVFKIYRGIFGTLCHGLAVVFLVNDEAWNYQHHAG